MPWTDTRRLRSYLGEEIPEGGTEADTLFTNDEIEDILTFKGTSANTQMNMWAAIAEGWDRKAGKLSDLVTIQQGGATRQLSDAFKNAVERAKYYSDLSVSRGTARSARIVRPGSTIR